MILSAFFIIHKWLMMDGKVSRFLAICIRPLRSYGKMISLLSAVEQRGQCGALKRLRWNQWCCFSCLMLLARSRDFDLYWGMRITPQAQTLKATCLSKDVVQVLSNEQALLLCKPQSYIIAHNMCSRSQTQSSKSARILIWSLLIYAIYLLVDMQEIILAFLYHLRFIAVSRHIDIHKGLIVSIMQLKRRHMHPLSIALMHIREIAGLLILSLSSNWWCYRKVGGDNTLPQAMQAASMLQVYAHVDMETWHSWNNSWSEPDSFVACLLCCFYTFVKLHTHDYYYIYTYSLPHDTFFCFKACVAETKHGGSHTLCVLQTAVDRCKCLPSPDTFETGTTLQAVCLYTV